MRLGTFFRAENAVTERLIGLRFGRLRLEIRWRNK